MKIKIWGRLEERKKLPFLKMVLNLQKSGMEKGKIIANR